MAEFLASNRQSVLLSRFYWDSSIYPKKELSTEI